MVSQIAVCQNNILTYMQMIEKKYGAFQAGELGYGHPNQYDTIIDIKNGYYEEKFKDNHLSIRQVAVFENTDSTKTIAITICEYDFVCMLYKTNFYKINKQGEIEKVNNLLPALNISDFISENCMEMLKGYFPEYQKVYPSNINNFKQFLNDLYEIHYIIPRYGTTIIVTLKSCDYLWLNGIIKFSPEDIKTIQTNIKEIQLIYDKKLKKFIKID